MTKNRSHSPPRFPRLRRSAPVAPRRSCSRTDRFLPHRSLSPAPGPPLGLRLRSRPKPSPSIAPGPSPCLRLVYRAPDERDGQADAKQRAARVRALRHASGRQIRAAPSSTFLRARALARARRTFAIGRLASAPVRELTPSVSSAPPVQTPRPRPGREQAATRSGSRPTAWSQSTASGSGRVWTALASGVSGGDGAPPIEVASALSPALRLTPPSVAVTSGSDAYPPLTSPGSSGFASGPPSSVGTMPVAATSAAPPFSSNSSPSGAAPPLASVVGNRRIRHGCLLCSW